MAPRKPTAAEIAAAPPPPPGATTTGPKPIGVPEGYIANRALDPSSPVDAIRGDLNAVMGAAQRRPVTSTVPTAPRYFDGDEWSPASLSAEDRARLQRAMVDAGVISKGTKFRLGIWDDASRGAYADLLAFANGAGMDVKTALSEYQRMRQYDEEEVAVRQPLTVRLSNPEDLRGTSGMGLAG